MKKLLLLLFAVAPLYVSAQESKFEETVKFINEKIACCAALYEGSDTNKVAGITATPDGRMTVSNANGQTYDLDLAIETYERDFIHIFDNNIFFYTETNPGRYWYFERPKDARQVGRALERLRSICLKAKN